jgi:GDP-D-mannose dehydratase
VKNLSLAQGDRLVGMVRRASTENCERIEHLRGNGTRKKSNVSSHGVE